MDRFGGGSMRRVKTAESMATTVSTRRQAEGLLNKSLDVGDAYADSGTSPPSTSNPRAPSALRPNAAPSAALSLADQIEQMGRALTAEDLAALLAVSRITIFKQAKAGRIP